MRCSYSLATAASQVIVEKPVEVIKYVDRVVEKPVEVQLRTPN